MSIIARFAISTIVGAAYTTYDQSADSSSRVTQGTQLQLQLQHWLNRN